MLWGCKMCILATGRCKCQGTDCYELCNARNHQKRTNILDVNNVSLDSSLVSLLKLAQMGLASRKTVAEVRILLLLSLSPLCFQLHLLLPCLHDTLTFIVWRAQGSLFHFRSLDISHTSSTRGACLFLVGLSSKLARTTLDLCMLSMTGKL